MMRLSWKSWVLMVVPAVVFFACSGTFEAEIMPTDWSIEFDKLGIVTSGGGGAPAMCVDDSGCDDKSACTTDVCNHEGICEHTKTETAPDDQNECTEDSCLDGAEQHKPRAGESCGQSGTLKCNDKGQCADCTPGMELTECPAPATLCQKYTCNADKVCEPENLKSDDMDLDDPVKGDCKKPQCDGNGAVIQVPSKDVDNLPLDDGNDCTDEVCDGMQPTHANLAPGESCNSMGGKVCDGAGHCVECVANANCTMGTTPTCNPMNHTCISCSDGVQNGIEKGIDCGGNCAAKCNGDACANDGECHGAHCADGVCCDTACGASDICKACNVPGQAGVCTVLSKGLEDPGTCSGGMNVCNGTGGNGACQPTNKSKAGGPCGTDSACYNGVCSAGICRLPIGAPCDEDAECETIRCASNVCIACVTGADCATGVCAGGVCTVQGGAPCGDDPDCAGGQCDSNKLCGRAVFSPCAVDADCSSHHCIGNTCTPCVGSMDLTCASMQCGGGSCLLPVNAYCSFDGQCSSSICAGFPKKCQ